MQITILTDSDNVAAIRRVPNGYIVSHHQVHFGGQPNQQFTTQEYVAETVDQVCNQIRRIYGASIQEEKG